MTITESIKVIEIKASLLLNLDFANDTILSYTFFFFLIIDLYILIPADIAPFFHRIAEIVIPIGIPIKSKSRN